MNLKQVIVSKEKFDQVVDKVLSEPNYWRFNSKTSKRIQPLIEKFKKWLEDMLMKHINGETKQVESISKLLSNIILAVIIIVLVGAIIYILFRIYRNVTGRGKVKEILGEKITKETTPDSLNEKAVEYEKQKEYRFSIRYRYISLLLLMHMKGIIYIESTMTNTEIYEYLKKETHLDMLLFQSVMEVFNDSWYGQKECEDNRYSTYKAEMDKLWNEVTAYEKK